MGTKFIAPMLLTPSGIATASAFIQSDKYCAQMKFDGMRCQIHLGKSVVAYSRTAKPVKLEASLEAALMALGHSGVVLDGELVEGVLYVFDVLMAGGVSVGALPYKTRLEMLEQLIPASGPVQRVLTTYTTGDKQIMFDTLRNMGAEGVIFKSVKAVYESRRSKNAFKVKFVATANVEVVKLNVERSVDIATAGRKPVGSVSIPPNKAIPAVGDVIEVRYLYAHRGGKLSQPVFIRVRTDAGPDSGTSLQYKGEVRAA